MPVLPRATENQVQNGELTISLLDYISAKIFKSQKFWGIGNNMMVWKEYRLWDQRALGLNSGSTY